ncbi:MAG: TIGR03790 family protein [Planctomycetota bacterium]
MTRALHRVTLGVALVSLTQLAFAGGSPENAVLVVDPTNAQSMLVANYYKEARDIPDANVVYMAPTPPTYAQFAATTLDAFVGALENARIADHVDYVILPPGGSFYMQSSGAITDQCFPVNRFSATAPYAMAFWESTLLSGVGSNFPNGYYRPDDGVHPFDSSTAYWVGIPNDTAAGRRYFIAAMLGYTGALGNTQAEVLAMIDRSVAVDGTMPGGTFYYMRTTDIARSGPRHNAYPAAVASLTALGALALQLFADLPIGNHDCLGIMTGLAAPDLDGANLSVLPGAFCDHLTSYAATFDEGSQTKMSRWISKGASGTSGAVEEPCNYSGKFPHARLHVFYRKGLSLGEAWFRSVLFAPFQTLFVGDPLTRPFAFIPSVTLSGLPPAPASGTIALAPSGTSPHPTAQVASFELQVDGRSMGSCAPGAHFALDTTSLADGWHELRVLGFDDTPARSVGRFVGTIETQNGGKSASLVVNAPSGDLATRFDFDVAASGGTVTAVRLLHNGRVVASSAATPATLSVHGRVLGAGRARLQAEVAFADRKLARSAPVELDVEGAAGTLSGATPVAYGYAKSVRRDHVALVELPSSFDTEFATATWTVLATPAQASVIGGSGPYRFVKPNANAAGADTLTFRVDTPNGSSGTATIVLVYGDPPACAAPSNYCIGAPNSVGPGASMSSTGSTRVGDNAFVVRASGLPPSTLGIFTYGQGTAQVPYGNGFRCIAPPFYRIALVQADGAGVAEHALDFASAPFAAGASAITVGSTWNFQLSYRNVAAGGALFNLTDGLSVTFCP